MPKAVFALGQVAQRVGHDLPAAGVTEAVIPFQPDRQVVAILKRDDRRDGLLDANIFRQQPHQPWLGLELKAAIVRAPGALASAISCDTD